MNIQHIRNNIREHYKKKEEDHYKEYTKKKNNRWSKYYQSSEWHLLRNAYYVAHPLCECCLKEGLVVPCDEVHHLHKFDAGITEEAKWRLLLNPNNLCSLCTSCHKTFHKLMREKNVDSVTIDEVIEYKNKNKIL